MIYRTPSGYALTMRLLYGRHLSARNAALAAQVRDGATVVDVCCGTGSLYLDELRGRVAGYVGLDSSPQFVRHLRSSGVDARVHDVRRDPLPDGDIVVMQAALYQFLPDARAVVDRMRAAARELVVISEPVRNLAGSRLPAVGRLAARLTGGGARFDEPGLDRLMSGYGDGLLLSRSLPGGRERLYVLTGGA